MDKFLIDPIENNNSSNVVQNDDIEMIDTYSPSVPDSLKQLTRESTYVEPETIGNVETGPPFPEEASSVVETIPPLLLKPTLTPVMETPLKNLNAAPESVPLEIQEQPIPIHEPVTLFSLLWWTIILLLFIILCIYYSFKYYKNKQNYIIKINADKFQLSLDNIREDIEEYILSWREWYENILNKINHYVSFPYIQNNTLKVKKYRIPKNRLKKDSEAVS